MAMSGWAAMAPINRARHRAAPSSLRPVLPHRLPAQFREGGGERGTYHDSFILKFSPDGKFLGEIGHANASKGSLDTDNVKGVAQIRFLPQKQRDLCWPQMAMATSASRCGTRTTLKLKRMWGAYGKKPRRRGPSRIMT
jgi:hypothetical protein